MQPVFKRIASLESELFTLRVELQRTAELLKAEGDAFVQDRDAQIEALREDNNRLTADTMERVADIERLKQGVSR